MHQPSDYHYHLNPDFIAQKPISPRDHAKLMLLNRQSKTITHHLFRDLLTLLTPNDVLVINDSKVFPARLFGTKTTGGKTELLLLAPISPTTWEALGKNLKINQKVILRDGLTATVIAKNPSGILTIRLSCPADLDNIGTTPIPPYIHSPLSESTLRQEYQTVYAKEKGSAAAPTAGMHFTTSLIKQLTDKGIQFETVTLHVGPGTFAKLTPKQLTTKTLHTEWYDISQETATRLNRAKANGKRIIAVGTTTCRTLESAYSPLLGEMSAGQRVTDIFIMPPYQFNFTDALITNFHLPASSLLMLITAFCHDNTFNHSFIHKAYQTAIENDYRFFSFGDAMMIE